LHQRFFGIFATGCTKLIFPVEKGRILAIDYGKKRVGLAVTDPGQMIATRLATVASDGIWRFLDDYFRKEKVILVLVGYPVTLSNEPSEAITWINPFIRAFVKRYPAIRMEQADERFTSRLAQRAMIDSGLKKKERQNKALVDAVSATILLQSYLEQQKFRS
jgi:putative Holliday junction resolvase